MRVFDEEGRRQSRRRLWWWGVLTFNGVFAFIAVFTDGFGHAPNVRETTALAAPISTGDIAPLMIWRISASISSWKISRCSMTRVRAS